VAKLRRLSGSDVADILQDNGFRFVRQKGSHAAYQTLRGGRTVTVIVPMHDEIRIGTLMEIVRQSGLDRSLFEVGR